MSNFIISRTHQSEQRASDNTQHPGDERCDPRGGRGAVGARTILASMKLRTHQSDPDRATRRTTRY